MTIEQEFIAVILCFGLALFLLLLAWLCPTVGVWKE